MKFAVFPVLGLLILGSCAALPNVGPTRSGIGASSVENGGQTHIVETTPKLAKSMKVQTSYGFPSAFFGSSKGGYENINAGDIINITVWENSDEGVFATLGNRVTSLSPMRVPESGKIFVPYVGELQAAGRTTEQLRKEITAELEQQTPFPQVEIQRETGQKGGVLIFGETGRGGLFPLNEGNLDLASMLASSGAGASDPQSTRLTVTRGSTSGTILMQDLYDNPRNNIALRANDRITMEADRRFYRMLGQGGTQNLVKFTRAEISLLDAISENGGLSPVTADATGVFVFRTVSAEEANRLFAAPGRYNSPQRFAFVVNMLEADGLFTAEDFQIRAKDTIYITEAPLVTWNRVISSVAGVASSVNDFGTIAGN